MSDLVVSWSLPTSSSLLTSSSVRSARQLGIEKVLSVNWGEISCWMMALRGRSRSPRWPCMATPTSAPLTRPSSAVAALRAKIMYIAHFGNKSGSHEIRY
uniref:Uncharacterized protein n=1 Tax=Arundo donax TaxID=35708 RepID=A0A0A9B9P9_ARUDO